MSEARSQFTVGSHYTRAQVADLIGLEQEKRRGFREGAMVQAIVNAYERNPAARRSCVDHYGCLCQVCGFNFEETRGELGKDFIHVHHLKEISSIGEEFSERPNPT